MTTFKSSQPGDIFQIIEAHERGGWVGCLVIATEIRPWGIIGHITHPHTHDEVAITWIRLNWKDIERVGQAVLVQKEPKGDIAMSPSGDTT